MPGGSDFIIRVMLPEEAEKGDVERILRGWAQVNSFGRTTFTKRVSGGEAARILSDLNALAIEYDLSIDDSQIGRVNPSAPVCVGRRKRESERVSGNRLSKTPPRSRRLPRLAGWSVGTMAVVLTVALTAALMTTDRSATTAVTGSVGLFEDDFIDNRYGWPVNESTGIDSGSYMVRNGASPKSLLVANERLTGRNLIAEVDVAILSGTEEGFAGLAYRIRNLENFYFFGVALDGSIAMLKRELGFWSRLEPGGGIRRSRTKPSLENRHHIRVVVKGIYSEFYVDGELISIVRDQSFERGLFGFYVDGNLEAAFSNLLLAFSEYESFDTDLPADMK